jgi:hypothetical protein
MPAVVTFIAYHKDENVWLAQIEERRRARERDEEQKREREREWKRASFGTLVGALLLTLLTLLNPGVAPTRGSRLTVPFEPS